ncbi:antibiotic biosynthesis monooxygenase [Siphonobacter curvatus]|uniref:Antibiotic biosynthesis monooxygenase n=2 Tax=Siphonobacter curvatus TaxID=2094562 RepID=A0A2S7IJG0_9BACT|nr:antibiotic biosynthesis monooxygenase [Siphonobacter curvatus]
MYPSMNSSDESHLIITIQSKPEHQTQIRELLLAQVDPIRREAGCLYYNLFQPTEDLHTFIILTGWATKEALDVHQSQPQAIRVVGQLTPLLARPIQSLSTRRLSENPV